MASATPESLLCGLYHHTVLPRDLPTREDPDIVQLEHELVTRLAVAVRQLATFVPLANVSHIEAIDQALSACGSINRSGRVDKGRLVEEMRQLTPDKFVLLYIKEQNAALLIYQDKPAEPGGSMIFEAFETSAPCENVLASQAALQWEFPGQAVAISYDIFSREDFQHGLAVVLEQASLESIEQFAAVTYKASATLPEIRDTPNPTLLTSAIMTTLRGIGSVHYTYKLRKRVRDTVSFKDARKPWRRSPFYLVLRVAMQRHLINLFGSYMGELYFKMIMCVFLGALLRDSGNVVPHEALHVLRRKLARRLSKLHHQYNGGSHELKLEHANAIGRLETVIHQSLVAVDQILATHWEAHLRKTTRIIRPLKQRAEGRDLQLKLTVSGLRLDRIMGRRLGHTLIQSRTEHQFLKQHKFSAASRPYNIVKNRLSSLDTHEEEMKKAMEDESFLTSSNRCVKFARMIEAYIPQIQGSFHEYPEIRSRQLLRLMEIWVAMEELATALYPLLRQYHPVFETSVLDVLELSTLDELRRLQAVQLYIKDRCDNLDGENKKTIFGKPSESSFAVRFYDTYGSATGMHASRQEIEQRADLLLAAKENEWQESSREHTSLIEEALSIGCDMEPKLDEMGLPILFGGELVQQHRSPCKKCGIFAAAKKIKIESYEHPLPTLEVDAKSIMFEILCPKAFAAYRDATWAILSSFAYPDTAQVEKLASHGAKAELKEVPLIRSYSGLRNYANRTDSKITLGSRTKSHLESHWGKSGFPVSLRTVCRRFCLRLDYYDSYGKTFTNRDQTPSLLHLFPLKVPADSPYVIFEYIGTQGPSSNQILAKQTRCPAELNVHEYMAWQSLLIGSYLRWTSLLRELGSTNLSFSTDSTWTIVSRLISQVGPATSHDILRDTHQIFRDVSFCEALLTQIEMRLMAIRKNWREPIQLDILISLLLKLASFVNEHDTCDTIANLIDRARSIAQEWCSSLKSSIYEEHTRVTFITWAAVLCKRTFYPRFEARENISDQALADFVEASILLQNSLEGSFDALPHILKSALLRDLHSSHDCREEIRRALMKRSQALVTALEHFWPISDIIGDEKLVIKFDPDSWWVVIEVPANKDQRHYVHYDSQQGTLLINGQELGSLPAKYRHHPMVKRLLKTPHMKALPSPMAGMSLVLDREMPYGYRLHLGFRDQELIIRTTRGNTVLHFVPSTWFDDGWQRDFPDTLIENCYHWLDIRTGVMEIRQQDPWKSTRGTWRLDLATRQAKRNSGSVLVDPNSAIASDISRRFHNFEESRFITVYQPRVGNVRVELKRLSLDFMVNPAGLLFCPQLGAAIAETRYQDIGTWHGLRSKLVVRTLTENPKLSVLVPMGHAIVKRDGPHVSIVVRSIGEYLKFEVNQILGQIECPVEPLMLYYRALWHALTAHYLPDTLTGRTGVDEALTYLESGAHQPWTPLAPSPHDLLLRIAGLSPKRAYYPPTLRVMETVFWNPNLTVFMQDDRYRRVINKILSRNADLQLFDGITRSGHSRSNIEGEIHLEDRALYRTHSSSSNMDEKYVPRDYRQHTPQEENVFAVATLMTARPEHFVSTEQLASLLGQKTVIGGYGRSFDKVQITDIFETDLGVDWGPLVQMALGCSGSVKYRSMFLFSLLAFPPDADMELLRAILSFAFHSELTELILPVAPAYSQFVPGQVCDVDTIALLMDGARRPYLPPNDLKIGQLALRRLKHDAESESACKLLARSLVSQWPRMVFQEDKLTAIDPTLLDRTEALRRVRPEWSRLVENFQFSQHLDEVQLILSAHDGAETTQLVPEPTIDANPSGLNPIRTGAKACPTLQDLLGKDLEVPLKMRIAPSSLVLPERPNGQVGIQKQQLPGRGPSKQLTVPVHIGELNNLIAPYKRSTSTIQRRYGSELQQSIKSLTRFSAGPSPQHEPFNPTKLNTEIFNARETVLRMLRGFMYTLQQGDSRAKYLILAGLWPAITPRTLLTQLSSTSGAKFGNGVQELLVNLALAIAALQRLVRIQEAALKGRHQQMVDELNNLGHTNWSPMDHVDWLLLEVDSNIMLRPDQVDVARATISPSSNRNSVVQLLMGKGKTSCILPIVALSLASHDLCRIIVPRTLLLQSAQIMQAKLGGLLNREISHIPFSRKTPTDRTTMKTYCRLHTYSQRHSGIIIALPEHILSFKLSGLQRLCDEKFEEASRMVKVQKWFDRHAREVLDESDVLLSIRTQLIYPSGSQHAVDGHPFRWQTVQALLDLVASYLDDLTLQYPHSIEVVLRAGYPLIYFLRPDVEDYLIGQIVERIVQGQTAILPISESSEELEQSLRIFLTMPVVPREVIKMVGQAFKEKVHLMNIMYHLRGLLVHRILLSSFKKRWNVQYGLHPARDPIAVPYQAKGVPSPTAEWGHPDVAIILTCLSFYYEGLSLSQMKQALEHLAKSDEPSIEYSLWVAKGVPDGFKNYNAINVEDEQQLHDLHKHLRHKVYALNFYLNNFVFPQHAKQFSKKLSASGSDLVHFDPTRSSKCRTSGFSGTNDTRHQLPMTIKQNDLPQLAHTNAEVLVYLLEERSRKYVIMVDENQKRLTEDGIVDKLLNPYGDRSDSRHRIRILIDAGAQVLEHDNFSFAKAWHKQDHAASAVVYFDKDHRPMVMYGRSTHIPLVASPFAENLEGCLVYIDESHCRGTDLKLPPFARAAVTLGPHLTKDALAQAAMRLRLLGTTQSVTFFSPPEVHQTILDIRDQTKGQRLGPVSSADVVRWLLKQTCDSIEQLEPLYYNQAMNFMQRTQAALDNHDFLEDESARNRYLEVVRSSEAQTLKQLYGPKTRAQAAVVRPANFAPAIRPYVDAMLKRKDEFQDRGEAVQSAALEEVEQEREMEHEVECVREVQAPVKFNAWKVPKLHADLKLFATTGRLAAGSDAVKPIFVALQQTALGMKHGSIAAAQLASRLYVSAQFVRTVNVPELNDNFIRPCQWLLWSRDHETGLLVTPEEADALIPILRARSASEQVCHLILYAAPITRRMLHFNELDYYAIPALPNAWKAPMWLKIQLGIFSGRLYFEWDEYEEIMSYLGARSSRRTDEQAEGVAYMETFTTKPLAFLHEWLAVRRKGQDFRHTPMGFVTTGKPLSAKHSFFVSDDQRELQDHEPHPLVSVSTDQPAEDEESDDDEEHAKEYFFKQHEQEDGHDVFHDAEEDLFDEEENTFFDISTDDDVDG